MRLFHAAVLMVLPVPAIAQATVGTMSGTLDGVPMAYAILDGEDIATGWREAEDGVEVRIEAYPADTPMAEDNRLTMTFAADAASRNPEIGMASITLLNDGTRLSGSEDAVAVQLNSFEVSGDTLTVLGNMRVTLSEGEENVPVLSPEGRTLSLDIQATVLRAEEDG